MNSPLKGLWSSGGEPSRITPLPLSDIAAFPSHYRSRPETGRFPRPGECRPDVIFRSRLHWLIRESGSLGHGCNRVLTQPLFRSGLHCPPFGSEPDFTKGLIAPSQRLTPRAAGPPAVQASRGIRSRGLSHESERDPLQDPENVTG